MRKKDNINITLFKANNFFFYYYFIPDGAKFYQFFDSQLRSPSQGRQQRFYMYISPLKLGGLEGRGQFKTVLISLGRRVLNKDIGKYSNLNHKCPPPLHFHSLKMEKFGYQIKNNTYNLI